MLPFELGNWSKNAFKDIISKWGIKNPKMIFPKIFPIFILEISRIPLYLTSMKKTFSTISSFAIDGNPQPML